MNVILSIKPIYADEIIQGRKKIEFRKTLFKKSVDRVYIYSSSPERKIIGYFTIDEIIIDTPKKLWDKYKDIGQIDKIDFFNYYEGKDKAIGISISKVVKLKKKYDPYKLIDKFKAPQSYMYIKYNLE